MNITKYITLSAAALLALTACEKDAAMQEPQAGEQMTITAYTEGANSESRTELNGTTTEWVSGDKIKVYGTTDGNDFTAVPVEGTPSKANFTGTRPAGALSMAIYPSTSALAKDRIKMPATIDLYNGFDFANLDGGKLPMAANLTASPVNDIKFQNLCGIIAVQVKNDASSRTIKKITLESPTDKIAGNATISFLGTDPILSFDSDATKKIEYSAEIYIGTSSYKTIYLPVPTMVSKDWKLIFEDAGGEKMTKIAVDTWSNKVYVGKILNMGFLTWETDVEEGGDEEPVVLADQTFGTDFYAKFDMKLVSAGTVDGITISEPYLIGAKEVTIGVYNGGGYIANYSKSWTSWSAASKANDFANTLNTRHASEIPEGYKFAVPTSDQWKYAAKSNISGVTGMMETTTYGSVPEEVVKNGYTYSVLYVSGTTINTGTFGTYSTDTGYRVVLVKE